MEAKEKDEWRYWQADLLLERGRDEEAQAILRSLMQQRGFYPMVAAQRLGEEYTFRIDKASGTIDPALASGPEMARVRELMYWNMDNTARTEWANLVTSRTKSQQAQLARYAFDQHWWDLSVQATIAGKLWDQLEERFPLAYNDLFARYVSGKDIPQSYAMAIARQESARNPKVRSPVGASGLMQIMPGTATHTVSMFSIPGYSGPSQLLIRKPTSTSAPAICSTFISSSAITVSTPQRPITPGRAGYAAGRGTAPDGSTPWRLSRVFRFRKPAAT